MAVGASTASAARVVAANEAAGGAAAVGEDSAGDESSGEEDDAPDVDTGEQVTDGDSVGSHAETYKSAIVASPGKSGPGKSGKAESRGAGPHPSEEREAPAVSGERRAGAPAKADSSASQQGSQGAEFDEIEGILRSVLTEASNRL